MNLKTQKNEEINWIWKGKSIAITKLDVAQLENCIAYTKKLPINGRLFGRSKQYWLNHLNKVITVKYNTNTNIIKNQMVESKKMIVNRFIDNLTINKTSLNIKNG